MTKPRWEHSHNYVMVDDDPELDEVLKSRGDEGWELVSVIEEEDESSVDKHWHLFFKRPV